jgi:hypothetical protein
MRIQSREGGARPASGVSMSHETRASSPWLLTFARARATAARRFDPAANQPL